MPHTYLPEGSLLTKPENHEYLSSYSGLEKALEKQKILESTVTLCDSDFCLHVDLGCIRGLMPRNEVQYNPNGEPIKDIAILTRVGKPICFKIVGFTHSDNGELCALLSRRAAQRECVYNFIQSLEPGDVLPAKVTHLESFGVFVDIGCGIVSLLSIDCISVSRISHPSVRLSAGDSIYCVVKSIDEYGRIYVSQRELLGTWEENANLFEAGQTVAGIVRSVESYGIFVELTPNLAGLAELRPNIHPGQRAAVYVKSILPEKMKIKLIIIDAHSPASTPPSPPRYFIDPSQTPHICRWRYSPASCSRIIETDFS